ncbi:hypothetical protein GCM10010965_32460 [Caldalkalibacillus thermarum]|uniref:hypothetical protein n=1 Tax=Caldalkalibacillus thermarum TaxID=296745 RepID=UPI00166F516C|nr:hypothetical protein [Caldalkalibacillus thermarum]GGK37118.1 hypothetical protein GCM10010965_32460 [Caldalkalibacillus thermarum]
MSSLRLVMISLVSLILIAVLTLITIMSADQNSTVKLVEQYYTAENGLIRAYGIPDNETFLSESIGLYMQYLLLAGEKERFDRQYNLLLNHFLAEADGEVFIQWKIGDTISTNSLVDDLRIIQVLTEAGHQFSEPK